MASASANGPDRAEHSRKSAYAYLDRRDRTEAELRGHLERLGVGAPLRDDTVRAMREQGFVDDARYARLFAQDKCELEQWGSERIGRALLERGVDPALVDAALAGEVREGELQRAVALLGRRCPAPPRDRRQRDRALGILLRKGYDSDLAARALAIHAGGAES